MTQLRKLINMLIYILLAPILGHEEACRIIAEEGSKEDKIFINILRKLKARGIISPRTIEEELLTISKNFELSGVDSTVYFEYLQMKVTEHLTSLKKRYSDMLSAILTGVIGIFMFSIILSLFTTSVISRFIALLIPLAFILNIHVNQIEIVQYNYKIPTIIATLCTILMFIILHYAFKIDIFSITMFEILVLTFSISFAVLYVPQFLKFVNLILNINNRVIRPIHEMLWDPMKVNIKGDTLIEREIQRLIKLGKSICSPWFISRISRLVDSLIDLIKSSIRSSILYGIFIPVGFFLVINALSIFSTLSPSLNNISLLNNMHNLYNIPIMLSFISLCNRTQLKIFQLVGAIVTSMVTGKTIHSIGLGISLIPIMLLACKVITGL